MTCSQSAHVPHLQQFEEILPLLGPAWSEARLNLHPFKEPCGTLKGNLQLGGILPLTAAQQNDEAI